MKRPNRLLVLALTGFLAGCGGETEEDGLTDPIPGVEDVELEAEATEVEVQEGVIRTADSGFAFIPDILTVTVDEEIEFVIGEGHTALQTDFNGWKKLEANKVEDGFHFPLGSSGGIVSFDEPGTYYFISEPYAEMGMRGQIIVVDP